MLEKSPRFRAASFSSALLLPAHSPSGTGLFSSQSSGRGLQGFGLLAFRSNGAPTDVFDAHQCFGEVISRQHAVRRHDADLWLPQKLACSLLVAYTAKGHFST